MPFSGGEALQVPRRILLGVCGGIAAYKVVQLVRLLQGQGHTVRVIGTPSSREFVGPATWEGLTGLPFATSMHESGSMMGHIHWPDQADLYIIAPATAHTLQALAQGVSDSLVTTAYLAAKCPVMVVPAMNVNMWQHAATQANVELLRRRGTSVVPTGRGDLACGWQGEGRMLEPQDILAYAERQLAMPRLRGLRVTVTAGATREFLDPVRYISNPSSGKMGLELAYCAWTMGAEVTVIAAQTARPAYHGSALEGDGWRAVWVDSAEQMRAAVLDSGLVFDWYISAAAVSDYTADRQSQKQKKTDGPQTIDLSRTVDILAQVGARRGDGQLIVGFAAETQSVVEYARGKLQAKNLDAIVYNDVNPASGVGFASESNAGGILMRDGDHVQLPLLSKHRFAQAILMELARRFRGAGA